MLPAGHREVWQSLKPLRDRGLGVHLGKARFRSVLPKVFCFATRTCCSRPVEGCWKSTFCVELTNDLPTVSRLAQTPRFDLILLCHSLTTRSVRGHPSRA